MANGHIAQAAQAAQVAGAGVDSSAVRAARVPHVVNAIMSFADDATLLAFRTLSRAMRTSADRCLFTHLHLEAVPLPNAPASASTSEAPDAPNPSETPDASETPGASDAPEWALVSMYTATVPPRRLPFVPRRVRLTGDAHGPSWAWGAVFDATREWPHSDIMHTVGVPPAAAPSIAERRVLPGLTYLSDRNGSRRALKPELLVLYARDLAGVEPVFDTTLFHAAWPTEAAEGASASDGSGGFTVTYPWGVAAASGVHGILYVFPHEPAAAAPLRPMHVVALHHALAETLAVPAPPQMQLVGPDRMTEGVERVEMLFGRALGMLSTMVRGALEERGADPNRAADIWVKPFEEWWRQVPMPEVVALGNLGPEPLNGAR